MLFVDLSPKRSNKITTENHAVNSRALNAPGLLAPWLLSVSCIDDKLTHTHRHIKTCKWNGESTCSMHVVIMCVCVFVELRAVIMELNCCKSAHVMYILLLHGMHKLVVVYHMYMYICWIFFDNVLLQCAPLYTRLLSFKCIEVCYIFSSKFLSMV